jgi:mannose-6-phosphate isomerase-like protein (cupin superfamily)
VTATSFVVDAGSVTGWPAPDGALIERAVLGAHTDSPWLTQSLLELDADGRVSRQTGSAEEVLFVLSGHGTVHADDADHELEPETSVYLPEDQNYELIARSDEDLLIVSVRVPDPVERSRRSPGVVLRRLAEQASRVASSERWFRILSDPDTGLRSATQFVGYIAPGRAADHFHTYDEVIFVLDGNGAFHAGRDIWSVGPGSCIAVPARAVHCLENTGTNALRVLGVFRPAGSPAAAYLPDGSAAHDAGEQTVASDEGEAQP